MRLFFKLSIENYCGGHLFVSYLLLHTLLWSLCIANNTCELKFGIRRNDNFNLLLNVKNSSDSQNNIINSFSVQCQHLSPKSSRNLSLSIGKKAHHNNKYNVQKSIYFFYYKNGKMLFKNSPGVEASHQVHQHVIKSCANGKISFIFHGWTESCYTDWIPKLIERLTFYRGGCVVCIDYSTWSKKSYMSLLQKFDPISEILYEEFLELIQKGLHPSNIFMFGFSYGGQLASKIGRLLKPKYNLKKMDICDMAGPGFDFLSYLNHSEAAENVQCYYTSLDKGSHFHSCHQNIRLGQCGYTQPAVLSQPYYSSHGLCVQIYINAFDYPFYAFQKPPRFCVEGRTINNLPHGFTVGYKENGYGYMIGDIFVPTTLNYPYNLSKKEMILYERYLDIT